MKAILISIQPKWCELIASGKKTVEVRKTAPKDTPFKVYMYCTKQKVNGEILLTYDKKIEGRNRGFRDNGDIPIAGKVIGEFICDKIQKIKPCFGYYSYGYDIDNDALPKTCLTRKNLMEYGKSKPLYGWHISELKIYDEPRELSGFVSCKHCHNGECFMTYKNDCVYREPDLNQDGSVNIFICTKRITCPPKLWQYVEEI